MNEPFEDGNEDYLPSIDSPGPPEPVYPCFRCGHCCRLWVFLGYEETERIMEHTKLSLNEFAIVYWDRSVGPEECLVLKQEDSACLFLRNGRNPREKYCGIYEARPRVCREFVPSYLRRECQDGLTRLWNLTAAPSGRLQGDEEWVTAFESFLREIVFGEKPK